MYIYCNLYVNFVHILISFYLCRFPATRTSNLENRWICCFVFSVLLSLTVYYKAVRSLRKKGTKSVTGAVPFQKVHFCA